MKPTYTLKENNAGGLLLTLYDAGDEAMIYTTVPENMGNYLHLARDGYAIDTIRDESRWGEEVEPDDMPTYADEWKDCPTIADNDGFYRDRAGVAGTKAIQLANLRIHPLAELAECTTADEVGALVSNYSDLIFPQGRYSPEREYRKHDTTWKICRIVYDKILPETYEEIVHLVGLWHDICSEMVGAEYIGIESYDTTGDAFEAVPFAEADTIMLTCERVNCRGVKPYDMTDAMARFISGEVLEQTDYDRDGETEWYYFKKI